ncbi:MAG TPA: WYL domain-containing protein [Acidimicrobiales bacterium]|nr:WYL domain-containing protein [Acidimicrobiales bacterium]
MGSPTVTVPPPPLDAGVRLRRLLAVLAYLAQVGEASIADLAKRFAMEEKTVISELELAACCGLPPYTPDQLLNLVVDDERVCAYALEPLRRPPRLTPSEGFALAAAARAIVAVTGDEVESPLRSALEKLEAALGSDRIAIEIDRPRNLEVLRRAAASGDVVEIDYLGAHKGDETTRVVEPYAVVAREGRFYLDAFCRSAKDWRRFQVGRVEAVRSTGERVAVRTPPPVLSGSRAFVGGSATIRRASVAVPAGRQVLLERVASGPGVAIDDERVVVPVDVADEAWFGVMMLRLGPDAEVLEPISLVDARAAAARRILDRYTGAS